MNEAKHSIEAFDLVTGTRTTVQKAIESGAIDVSIRGSYARRPSCGPQCCTTSLLIKSERFSTRHLEYAVPATIVYFVGSTHWKAAHDRFPQTGILRDAGIPLRPDRHYAIFHHKFIVIDGATLEIGLL